MSTQHTPTPWEIVWERDTDHNPPKRAQSVGPVSADHDHWSGWTVCDEADAEFVVRACNSYDALLAALEDIGSRPCFSVLLGEDTSECGCPPCTARDAIAKARGTRVCPLCDHPSFKGEVHQECADREQCRADAIPVEERKF